jgi:MarR family transcriptional regulator, lower aerobic nicotinate degradation pathway regulator
MCTYHQYADNKYDDNIDHPPVKQSSSNMPRVKKTDRTEVATKVDLDDLPGHYIRRLQQIAVAIFLDESKQFEVTPVQYAALQAISNNPGIDQRTLARMIGFDTSTIAGVIDRLDARGLVTRGTSDTDRRVRLLRLTAAGHALAHAVVPNMLRAQERILEPLSAAQRIKFMAMLRKLVEANNEMSRAPGEMR